MVLVDTSVWIRSLASREPFRSELDRLLGLDEVAGHELVYGELLIGDRGGRRNLLASYGLIQHAKPVPHHEIVRFVCQRDLHGRGVGWVDIHLLASAVAARMQFWTCDQRCLDVAQELGVAYASPDS